VNDLASPARATPEPLENARPVSAANTSAELAAIAVLFKFEPTPRDLKRLQYPQETLAWSTTGLNSGVWVSIFLFTMLAFNLIECGATKRSNMLLIS
jgi:hypothetical protein